MTAPPDMPLDELFDELERAREVAIRNADRRRTVIFIVALVAVLIALAVAADLSRGRARAESAPAPAADVGRMIPVGPRPVPAAGVTRSRERRDAPRVR